MKRLAIITSHPIQYNAPLFQLISKRNNIRIKVFYTWQQSADTVYDPDFGIMRNWDIPILEGYDFEFVKNIAKNPGSHHFMGIVNPDILKVINNYQPDGLLVYGWAFSGHLRVLRFFKGKIPVYFRGDSTLLNESQGFSFKKLMKLIFLKWVYSFVDIAFYTGIQNKKYFLKYGLKENQLVFAPHAIQNERFFPNHENKNLGKELRKRLSIKDYEIVILFAGKFQYQKDPKTLILAFQKLANNNCHLVMVGDGILKEELKLLSGNNKNIHFLPFQNQTEMPALYQLCDIFILPSISETWGLSVNEAMASGKPVIATDRTGSSVDLIKPYVNGFTFRSSNAEELVEIFKVVCLNKELLLQYGVCSLELIKQWNFDNLAESIESVLLNNKAIT